MESIIKQTFINYELILVDDGSTDGTVEYLKCLRSALPKQTKIFYFDHKGAANARNFGLSQVAGEYVLFLDSDDFFEAYFFEKLYENISQNNKPDLVVCEFWIFSDKEKKDVKHKKLCLPNEAREITNSSLIYFLSPNVWNKCFKVTFIREKELLFEDLKSCNDFSFTYSAIALAETFSFIQVPLVHYRIATEMNISNTRGRYAKNIYTAINTWIEFLVREGVYAQLQQVVLFRAWRAIRHELFCCSVFEVIPFILNSFKMLKNISFGELLKISSLDTMKELLNVNSTKGKFK